MTKEIKPATRVSEVKEYYFSKKLREVARLNAEGRDIISLGIGGPDRIPADEVIDTLCDEARKEGNHSYQSYTGLPALRKAYADFYSRWYGVDLNPDNEILPLIGSKGGIRHISLALLNPGDGVLVPNPGYPTYTSVSRLAQAEIFPYDLTEKNGWYPDFGQLEKMPLDRIKLMWVNYPHMPTGTPATMELFERLVDFGRRHGIVIAHDTAGAAKGLAAAADWYRSVNATYARRREIAEEIMTALGCTFDPSQRGLFLWGRIADSESGSEAVADRALYEARVFVTPGFIFGSNGDRYIRISLCATEEKMCEALERIRQSQINNK